MINLVTYNWYDKLTLWINEMGNKVTRLLFGMEMVVSDEKRFHFSNLILFWCIVFLIFARILLIFLKRWF